MKRAKNLVSVSRLNENQSVASISDSVGSIDLVVGKFSECGKVCNAAADVLELSAWRLREIAKLPVPIMYKDQLAVNKMKPADNTKPPVESYDARRAAFNRVCAKLNSLSAGDSTSGVLARVLTHVLVDDLNLTDTPVSYFDMVLGMLSEANKAE